MTHVCAYTHTGTPPQEHTCKGSSSLPGPSEITPTLPCCAGGANTHAWPLSPAGPAQHAGHWLVSGDLGCRGARGPYGQEVRVWVRLRGSGTAHVASSWRQLWVPRVHGVCPRTLTAGCGCPGRGCWELESGFLSLPHEPFQSRAESAPSAAVHQNHEGSQDPRCSVLPAKHQPERNAVHLPPTPLPPDSARPEDTAFSPHCHAEHSTGASCTAQAHGPGAPP